MRKTTQTTIAAVLGMAGFLLASGAYAAPQASSAIERLEGRVKTLDDLATATQGDLEELAAVAWENRNAIEAEVTRSIEASKSEWLRAYSAIRQALAKPKTQTGGGQ
ncbi:hypothetical protein BB934_45575 (plasmid) [Microvirga ossetica]|uniref:Uncharacterized protein n=1 Tax=Microvirga ossetica TaxID=1882682 RepID=A0A1B2EZY7_9HYPH|nr:hypothetical protein [Microvirga ossetica]ANY85493.1 hypothetical protein BB934_45575 [Microvirga ossetica]